MLLRVWVNALCSKQERNVSYMAEHIAWDCFSKTVPIEVLPLPTRGDQLETCGGSATRNTKEEAPRVRVSVTATRGQPTACREKSGLQLVLALR